MEERIKTLRRESNKIVEEGIKKIEEGKKIEKGEVVSKTLFGV